MIRAMREEDVDNLSTLTSNENVYRYIPPFLYKKSRGNLLAAIRNLSGRDFEKRNSLSQESIFKMIRKSWLALRKSLM